MRTHGAQGALPFAEQPRSSSEIRQFLTALVDLCKPRVTRLVVITAWLGAVIAPGSIHWGTLLVALVGTALLVAGANALNMVLEAPADALMERTRGRPIPSGRLSNEVALLFSLALAVMGFAVLARWANALTCLLAVGAFLIYALVYTPAKRLSPYALHLGAVPGAIPPLIGWVSMTGNLSLAGWSLFAILFVWQLPHFMAIALFRAADYQRAGFRVYPSAKGTRATQRAMIFWSLVLAATTLLPWWGGLAGPLYAAVAVLLGAAFCGWVIAGPRKLGLERWARSVFAASIPYLVLVFGALAFGAQ